MPVLLLASNKSNVPFKSIQLYNLFGGIRSRQRICTWSCARALVLGGKKHRTQYKKNSHLHAFHSATQFKCKYLSLTYSGNHPYRLFGFYLSRFYAIWPWHFCFHLNTTEVNELPSFSRTYVSIPLDNSTVLVKVQQHVTNLNLLLVPLIELNPV